MTSEHGIAFATLILGLAFNAFWKKALPIYICDKLFTKTQPFNLALAFHAHFLEWCLIPFGKELSNYTCTFPMVSLYTYIYYQHLTKSIYIYGRYNMHYYTGINRMETVV